MLNIGILYMLKDIEFMKRTIEDLEKSMKRSNDKQLKVEHEVCLKVSPYIPLLLSYCFFCSSYASAVLIFETILNINIV